MSPASPPGRHTERGSTLHWVATLVVVGVLTAAAVVYVVRRPYAAEETHPGVPPGLVEPPFSGPGLVLEEAEPPSDVLADLGPAAPISEPALRHLLDPVVSSAKLGRHLSFAVAQLGDDGLLWKLGGPGAVTPASTLKLLTAVTALQQLGPEHRFETSVVSGRGPRQIVLVGGGDPLLTDDRLTPDEAAEAYPIPATLAELAADTASALKADGRHTVSLAYDDSLFSGPAVNPEWEPNYVPESIVSPITALWVDEGRSVKGLARRVADPSADAARRFGALLRARGIVIKGAVTRSGVKDGARRLAVVASPPLAEIVQHVLEVSDNEGAEVLLRQAALAAGRPGSFAGGVTTVERTMSGLGVDVSRAVIYDGSGLSRQDLLPIETLVAVLQVTAHPAHPDLRTVVSTLPVAGFTGSLDYRFVVDATAGLGLVRAKTGTLTGIHAMTGVVVSRDGQAMVFAAVADEVPVRKTLAARAQLDRIAAALATCGC